MTAWVLYVHGYGVNHPVSHHNTAEEVLTNPRISFVEWTKTHEGGYIGIPFGDKAFPHFYTLNQDGQAVHDLLRSQ